MIHFPSLRGAADLLRSLSGQRVAVLGHVRPDGDCIGSQVGLTRVLRALGADAFAINQHPVPGACTSFVGDTPFFLADDPSLDLASAVAISVDCADRRRLGEDVQAAFPEILANFDHHISNAEFAQHNYIVADSAATGEILAGLCLDAKLPMDAVTAQAFYVGLATDTGQFRFGSTTAKSFQIACELISHGADPAAAALALYENEPKAKLALLQRYLASFEYHCDGRVCLGLLRQEDWDATGAQKEDTEGLVDYARAIEGVEIGVLLEERGDQVKGSFRAKDPVHRVDQIAQQFNGGGHACAAGFNPYQPLETLRTNVLAALEIHFAPQP